MIESSRKKRKTKEADEFYMIKGKKDVIIKFVRKLNENKFTNHRQKMQRTTEIEQRNTANWLIVKRHIWKVLKIKYKLKSIDDKNNRNIVKNLLERITKSKVDDKKIIEENNWITNQSKITRLN